MADPARAFEDHAVGALSAAFDDHMKLLFGNFVRHLGSNAIDEARREFRKSLALSKQALSEMMAILEE